MWELTWALGCSNSAGPRRTHTYTQTHPRAESGRPCCCSLGRKMTTLQSVWLEWKSIIKVIRSLYLLKALSSAFAWRIPNEACGYQAGIDLSLSSLLSLLFSLTLWSLLLYLSSCRAQSTLAKCFNLFYLLSAEEWQCSYASGTNKIGHTSSLNLTKTPLGDVNKGNFIIYDKIMVIF